MSAGEVFDLDEPERFDLERFRLEVVRLGLVVVEVFARARARRFVAFFVAFFVAVRGALERLRFVRFVRFSRRSLVELARVRVRRFVAFFFVAARFRFFAAMRPPQR